MSRDGFGAVIILFCISLNIKQDALFTSISQWRPWTACFVDRASDEFLTHTVKHDVHFVAIYYDLWLTSPAVVASITIDHWGCSNVLVLLSMIDAV